MAKLYVDSSVKQGLIHPEIYGQFSEHLGRGIYDGIFVGEDSEIPNTNGMRNDVVDALKEMRVPVLRWPGGCFADEYDWKDGIGPKEIRKRVVNVNWGKVVEDNSFGTHEYFELCRQLGCKTYINGNVGSGTIQNMKDWIEYMTFAGNSPMADLRKENGQEEPWTVDYFGVGNENWGCGGNMTPQYYGNLYRRYQTFVRNYDSEKPIYKICCGANASDYEWTEEVLKTCSYKAPEHLHCFMDGISLHYYTLPYDNWGKKGSATEFETEEYYITLHKAERMKELIRKHSNIMSKYAEPEKIGLIVDEWGGWYDVEPGTNPGFLYQQSTMRDAIIAAINFDIFNENCQVVRMANIAQMVNVLAASVLTEGPDMLLTPTYYAFHMYRYHQGAELIHTKLTENEKIGMNEEQQVSKITCTVSKSAVETLNLTITNTSVEEAENVEVTFAKATAVTVKEANILSGKMNAFNSFDDKERVKESAFDRYEMKEGIMTVALPPCSIVQMRIDEIWG